MTRFNVEEQFNTELDEQRVMCLLEHEFTQVAVGGGAKRQANCLIVESVNDCVGWIYRCDVTQVRLESHGDGYLCVAAVEYQPSKMFHSVVWFTGLISLFGWVQPVIFYHYQKRTVRRSIEDVLRLVKRQLESETYTARS